MAIVAVFKHNNEWFQPKKEQQALTKTTTRLLASSFLHFYSLFCEFFYTFSHTKFKSKHKFFKRKKNEVHLGRINNN